MRNSSQIMKSGIYKITNLINGKIYIGSAVSLRDRWLSHKSFFRRNKHQNIRFQRSWNLHGENAFIFEVVEYVGWRHLLIEREQFWIDKTQCYDPHIGYNSRKIADSGIGTKRTEEAKARMSEAAKRRAPMSEETRLKISMTKKGNSPLSDEAKAKLRLCLIGRAVSPETRAKTAASLKGRKYSAERVAAMVAGRNYATNR